MPVIGLGTHQTFDVGLAPGIRETVGDVLRQFFDAGGSMIDSSPMYGRAEAVCGEVLVETGLQNRAFRELEDVMVREDVDFVQLPYSIVVRAAGDRILSVAADRGVGVIVNRPYDGGGLSSAVRDRQVPDWAAEFDCTGWGQFFLKYLLGHPAITCVIPATGQIDHLAELVAAGEGRLPDAEQRARMVEFMENL